MERDKGRSASKGRQWVSTEEAKQGIFLLLGAQEIWGDKHFLLSLSLSPSHCEQWHCRRQVAFCCFMAVAGWFVDRMPKFKVKFSGIAQPKIMPGSSQQNWWDDGSYSSIRQKLLREKIHLGFFSPIPFPCWALVSLPLQMYFFCWADAKWYMQKRNMSGCFGRKSR